MERGIAVRLYDNPKFGKSFGKNLFRHAIFNGTADISQPKLKYLLDLLTFDHWQHTAKTDEEMQILAMAFEYLGDTPPSDVLSTWIKRFDSSSEKPTVFGFAMLNVETNQLAVLINDTEKGMSEAWGLDVKPCKENALGKRSAQLLATNMEL